MVDSVNFSKQFYDRVNGKIEHCRLMAERHAELGAAFYHAASLETNPDKIDQKLTRYFFHQNREQYYRQKVDRLLNSELILSDDPEALPKLQARIFILHARRLEMRRENALWRKNTRGRTNPPNDQLISHLKANAGGLAPYSETDFTSVRKQILKTRKRIAALQLKNEFPIFSVRGAMVELFEGQIQITFPGTPDKRSRNALKKPPLSMHWSPYQKKWVRKFVGQNSEWVEKLKKILSRVKLEPCQ